MTDSLSNGSMKVPTILGGLNVTVSGEGKHTIAFWPSLLMAGYMFDEQVTYFNAKGYKTIVIDPPGQGKSDDVTELFTLYECAACVVQVLDHLNIDKCFYAGNSWGGMTGGLLGALYPHRFHAVICMNCTSSQAGWYQSFSYRLLTIVGRQFSTYPSFLIGEALKAFVGVTAEREKPEVIERVKTAVRNNKMLSGSYCITSIVPLRPDTTRLLETTKVPALVVAGEEDRTFSISEAQRMAKAMRAELVVLEKTAHLAAMESPDLVNATIDKFLSKVLKN